MVLKGITDLFVSMGRGLQRLALDARIIEEQKNIKLANEGYTDVGRIILPIDSDQKAAILARSEKALAELQEEQQKLDV